MKKTIAGGVEGRTFLLEAPSPVRSDKQGRNPGGQPTRTVEFEDGTLLVFTDHGNGLVELATNGCPLVVLEEEGRATTIRIVKN